jgi:hypothetical protein
MHRSAHPMLPSIDARFLARGPGAAAAAPPSSSIIAHNDRSAPRRLQCVHTHARTHGTTQHSVGLTTRLCGTHLSSTNHHNWEPPVRRNRRETQTPLFVKGLIYPNFVVDFHNHKQLAQWSKDCCTQPKSFESRPGFESKMGFVRWGVPLKAKRPR